jgi:hypothetical protein
VSDFAAAPVARQLVASSLAHLPADLNARAQAWWHCKRARNELAALGQPHAPAEHLTWVANGARFLPVLQRTADVLAHRRNSTFSRQQSQSWSEDLPRAAVGSPALSAIRERTS